jgi:oligosaccharyltransferase complex subunit delta (ribophorin II)
VQQCALGVLGAAPLKTSDVRVLLVEHDGAVSRSLAVPAKGGAASLALEHSQELHVAIDLLGSRAPHQAFLKARHADSGVASFVAAAALPNGTLTWKLTSAHIAKQIGAYGGPFSLQVLLGDASLPTPLRIELGTVRVGHLPLPSGEQPAAPVATQAIVAHAAPKPEITHMHRIPDRRPPSLMALVFTALTFVPLAALLAYIRAIGGNLKGFTGAVAASGTVFHGILAAFLALFALFWIRLNLMQTLPAVAVLGAAACVSGYVHLNQVSLHRKD